MNRDEQTLAREMGLTLQRLRRERGLTQKHLAQQVAGGINATYVGKIERGDQLPSLKVLLRLSKALGVPISTFFYASVDAHEAQASSAGHLEPLLQALRNRGIDGISLVCAVLDAIGQHVLVAPPRRTGTDEPAPAVRADRRVIPLPMSRSRPEE